MTTDLVLMQSADGRRADWIRPLTAAELRHVETCRAAAPAHLRQRIEEHFKWTSAALPGTYAMLEVEPDFKYEAALFIMTIARQLQAWMTPAEADEVERATFTGHWLHKKVYQRALAAAPPRPERIVA